MNFKKASLYRVGIPLLFGLVLYVLTVQLIYILIGLVGYFSVITLLPLLKDKFHISDTDRAWEFWKDWWFQKTGEVAGIVQGHGIVQYFGPNEKTKKIGFRIIRANGLPMTCVISLFPSLDVADFNDTLKSTADDAWQNPFKAICGDLYVGAPSPEAFAAQMKKSAKGRPKKDDEEENEEKEDTEYGRIELRESREE